jgi:putative ABC transport system permease protein
MWKLTSVSPGFRADHVLTLRVQASGDEFPSNEQRAAYFARVFDMLRALPGVEQAGSIQHLPLSGFNWHRDTEIEGRPAASTAPPFRPGYRIVGGSYFDALSIPLVQGRAFGREDDASRPGVAIVNAEFARSMFPGESAIGKRIRPQRMSWLTIVGVVGDVRHVSLTAPAEPEFFVPLAQVPQSQAQIVVRTSTDPASTARAAFNAVSALNRTVPVSNLQTMQTHVSASVTQPRVVMLLLVAFALVGLTLGVVGIYGVVGYTVAMRTREIGIRMALGSTRGAVDRMLLREGVVNATLGILVGLAAALALSRSMQSLLFDTSSRNPGTYLLVVLLLLAAAVTASWLPARRGSRTDPLIALRGE